VGRPLRGQDETAMRRDRDACRRYASEEVESPLLAGLAKKAVLALGGAALGAGVVIFFVSGGGDSGPSAPSSSEDSKTLAIAIGAGAALGFVLGSIAGTFVGAVETMDAVEARENVYARCMKERGYEVPTPSDR
jgi:hypothetical protein